ncbi:MAG TPA: 3-deoxy-7-phosphoheptulonate synthase [Bacteroidales bacterium]|nr:3-deoxy-7-phosphoheptulonate synthase [Bacteroidales bacterium]
MKNFNDIQPIETWFEGINKLPLIISGPCSAENRIQVLETGKQLHATGKIRIYRAGIWKPRTRPGSFEGVGALAFPWLKELKKETGMLIAVEAATAEHVKLCTENSDAIDILWIGARTVSNPFSMQALADALVNSHFPVLVKNPINPELALWMGAIERLLACGITKIAAIHRGFYPFEKTRLRNIPKWEIPIELKIRIPNLSIINDPSHISGTTEYIREIAQKALDLSFDGLIIESHYKPEEALSDKAQQLKPSEINELLNSLEYRCTETADKKIQHTLEKYRHQIDSIDFQLLELLKARMDIVERIGEYKIKNNISIFQLRRWREILDGRIEYGNKLGLSESLVRKLLQIVHEESVQVQTQIFNQKL